VKTDYLTADMENLGFKMEIPSATSSQTSLSNASLTTTPKISKKIKRVDIVSEYSKRVQQDERLNLVVVGIDV
jgi:hypothetical protein